MWPSQPGGTSDTHTATCADSHAPGLAHGDLGAEEPAGVGPALFQVAEKQEQAQAAGVGTGLNSLARRRPRPQAQSSMKPGPCLG